MNDLAQRLTHLVENPATTAEFDIHAALTDLLGVVGLQASDSGGTVHFEGADPVVPSALRLAGATGLSLVAKSVAVAAMHQDRGGPGQDITMDLRVAPHRLCPFYDRKWELLNGYPAAAPAMPDNAFGFYPTRDDRWVMPLNFYPNMRVAAHRLLGCVEHPRAVAEAISQWAAADLEQAGAEAGVVMPMVRSTAEFLAAEHFHHVAAEPVVEVTRIGDSEPEPLPMGAIQPLDGVRALGMGHVIAGAGVGRALALHGADVLNIWRPDEFEHDTIYVTANVGMRSTTLDPRQSDARTRILALLKDADVFFANRRPGYLDRIGMSDEHLASARPGIIHATNSFAGRAGPWADRVGFDQSAGAVVGMATLESGGNEPRLSPVMVVNDYIVSWLTQLGVVAALRRRAREGGSYRVHVSLTRAALWILELGVLDLDFAKATAGTVGGPHEYLDPEVFRAVTPMGRYQGVTDQVQMSATPGHYRDVLLPRGSSDPVWLDRSM